MQLANGQKSLQEILFAKGFRPDGNGGWSKPDTRAINSIPDNGGTSNSKRPPQHALESSVQAEEALPARYSIRINVYRVRPADRDNEYASPKLICDAFRYAGILPDDDPETLQELICTPCKANRVEDERTEIIFKRL